MKKIFLSSLMVFTVLSFFWSCQKELSLENGSKNSPSGGGFGWSFKGNTNESYQGCIDTAYYLTAAGVKALVIEGTDSAANSFMITVPAQSGSVKTGTYTTTQGATLIVNSSTGTFTASQPNSFTLNITAINDTLVEGNFSGTLSDPISGGNFVVKDGKVKALIGKTNPCGPAVIPDPIVPSNGSYFPLTTNSNWVHYIKEASPTYIDSVETVSTGNTQAFAGKSYTFLSGGFEGYYRQEGGDYFRFGTIDFYGLADTIPKPVNFLKDNVAKGTTWESVIVDGELASQPVKFKTKYTIVDKNISVTVMGKAYSNVIVVSEELLASTTGSTFDFQTVLTLTFKYAKGVGLIQLQEPFSQTMIDLQRYKVF